MEPYHNAIKYKTENMQQWWRQEAKNLEKMKAMQVPPPTVRRPHVTSAEGEGYTVGVLGDNVLQLDSADWGGGRSPPIATVVPAG